MPAPLEEARPARYGQATNLYGLRYADLSQLY